MDNSYQIYADNPFLPSSHRVILALGRLQARFPQEGWGSVYVYDLIEQCTLCCSYALSSLLGYTSPPEHMTPFGLAQLIHPDDLGRVADHYQRFAMLQPTEVIQMTYRMQHADGSWRWLRSLETPLVSAIDGFPLQILGIVSLVVAPTASTVRRRRLRRPTARRSQCRPRFRPRSPSEITHPSACPPSSPPSHPTSS